MENDDLYDKLHSEFIYANGNLYRKVGSCDGKYVNVQFEEKRYGIHRLIFLMHNGYLPVQVDHIDGNGLNNNIENLRAANPMQNQMNARLRSTNTSGVKGVGWNKKAGKWTVKLRSNGKMFYLGRYEDLELAELVANEFRSKYHGEFARHN